MCRDECFRKIWKTLGTRRTIFLGRDVHVVSYGRSITLGTNTTESLHSPLGLDINI